MWKVDYGCIDLVPPTPPLFNLFLSGGGNNVQPKRQKESTTRYTKVPSHLHTVSHNARGSYNNVSAPYKIYDVLMRVLDLPYPLEVIEVVSSTH